MSDAARLQPWAGFGAAARSCLARVAGMTALWRDRARDRQALRRLNDHMLRDIGLTRQQVMIEHEKPFWRP